VNARITLATARRVLNQLRRDPRTVALLFVVPAVLLSLLRWMLANQRANFDHIGAPVLAIAGAGVEEIEGVAAEPAAEPVAAREPISVDEIIDLHLMLKGFQGTLTELVQQPDHSRG